MIVFKSDEHDSAASRKKRFRAGCRLWRGKAREPEALQRGGRAEGTAAQVWEEQKDQDAGEQQRGRPRTSSRRVLNGAIQATATQEAGGPLWICASFPDSP